MKVLFICGSLEPGKDGVGDYVTTLSSRLLKLGFKIFMVALYDRHLKSSYVESVSELRISNKVLWPDREKICRNAIERFDPEMISFHFVPYAYSKKGILSFEIIHLKRILKDYSVHIMFHELWVEGNSLKIQLLAFLQRKTIVWLTKEVKPGYIHTSNEYYQHRLLKYGINSLLYPVFSNIPVCVDVGPVEQTVEKKVGIRKIDDVPFFLSFGAIHPDGGLDIFLDKVVKYYGKGVMISAGRSGNSGKEIWHRLKEKYGTIIHFVELGYLKKEELSYLIRLSDFGVTTNPEILLKKSGSVAAFVEHGTPMIYTRKDFHDRSFMVDSVSVPELCFHISRVEAVGFDFIRELRRFPLTNGEPEKYFLRDVLCSVV